jgi:hypothetical protein
LRRSVRAMAPSHTGERVAAAARGTRLTPPADPSGPAEPPPLCRARAVGRGLTATRARRSGDRVQAATARRRCARHRARAAAAGSRRGAWCRGRGSLSRPPRCARTVWRRPHVHRCVDRLTKAVVPGSSSDEDALRRPHQSSRDRVVPRRDVVGGAADPGVGSSAWRVAGSPTGRIGGPPQDFSSGRASGAERIRRFVQPTRGNLAVDPQLNSSAPRQR